MMEILNVSLRTIFFYFFILLCYRLMGKREIGQLSISDLTISVLMAELVAISIENKNDSPILTILPIILLVLLEIVLSFVELKSNRIRRIIDGKPSIIINNGKLNVREMIKQRFSMDDLLLSLRGNEIRNIKDVDYAILENNGILSVFKKGKDTTYPLPLIIDGSIDYETLESMNKNKIWLDKILLNNDLTLKNVLYAFYKDNIIYIIKK